MKYTFTYVVLTSACMLTQSCLSLCDAMDCSSPGSSVSLSNTHNQEETSKPCVWTLVPWQSEALGDLRECSLLTPLVVGRSRIQICTVTEGCCAKISTQTHSVRWNPHTYTQKHKCYRLPFSPWLLLFPIFRPTLKTDSRRLIQKKKNVTDNEDFPCFTRRLSLRFRLSVCEQCDVPKRICFLRSGHYQWTRMACLHIKSE